MSFDRKKLVGRIAAGLMRRMQKWLEGKTPLQVEKVGIRFGHILMRAAKRRRETAMSNLLLAFPEMPESDRRDLTKKTFEHFGICTADFLSSGAWTKEYLDETTEIHGLENLVEALALNKGVIVVTGHFGNWERVNLWSGFHGYPLHVVVRTANDEGVDKLVNDLRGRTGTGVIPRGNATRSIIQKLRMNEIVGIVPDQNSDEVFIPFFGKPAGTVLGPGVLHERTGAPVLPVSCIRRGVGLYKLIVYPPLPSPSGYDVKGEGLMRALNDWLESAIREHPEQWLWFHDRWRNAKERGLL